MVRPIPCVDKDRNFAGGLYAIDRPDGAFALPMQRADPSVFVGQHEWPSSFQFWQFSQGCDEWRLSPLVPIPECAIEHVPRFTLALVDVEGDFTLNNTTPNLIFPVIGPHMNPASGEIDPPSDFDVDPPINHCPITPRDQNVRAGRTKHYSSRLLVHFSNTLFTNETQIGFFVRHPQTPAGQQLVWRVKRVVPVSLMGRSFFEMQLGREYEFSSVRFGIIETMFGLPLQWIPLGTLLGPVRVRARIDVPQYVGRTNRQPGNRWTMLAYNLCSSDGMVIDPLGEDFYVMQHAYFTRANPPRVNFDLSVPEGIFFFCVYTVTVGDTGFIGDGVSSGHGTTVVRIRNLTAIYE